MCEGSGHPSPSGAFLRLLRLSERLPRSLIFSDIRRNPGGSNRSVIANACRCSSSLDRFGDQACSPTRSSLARRRGRWALSSGLTHVSTYCWPFRRKQAWTHLIREQPYLSSVAIWCGDMLVADSLSSRPKRTRGDHRQCRYNEGNVKRCTLQPARDGRIGLNALERLIILGH